MFHNSGKLLFFLGKADRLRITVWLFSLTVITIAVPLAFGNLYPTQAERDVMAQTLSNPALTAMVGPVNFETYTIGTMTAHEMVLLTALVVGLMNILFVNRHTRVEEEEGLLELVRSLPTGKGANMMAVFLHILFINLLLVLLISVGLGVLGIESMGWNGSMLYGMVLGGSGIFFAGITAISAQLADNARTSFGIAFAVLMIAYLVRAVGDVSAETLSWFSPLHLSSQAEVYGANHWWTILPLFGVGILLFAVAGYMASLRDLDAGLLRSRAGKTTASSFLGTPTGLALRLQRTGIISWGIAMLLLGASYGSILGDLETFFEGNEILQQMLAGESSASFTEQFLSLLIVVIALIATIPALMSMLKLYKEEKSHRVDLLYAHPLSRFQFFASHLSIAAVQGLVMFLLAFAGLWMAGVAVMTEPFSFLTIVGAGMAYYPALLVMVGVTVLLIGFFPEKSGWVWAYLLYAFIVLYFGGLFEFPEWMEYLSPFGYVPELPNEDMTWLPLILLSMVALVMVTIGFRGYKRRDLQG
ncbi:ABC transporter permease [Salimicrobium flavidum]|uniref:ABC-2 type transport system permease protein n=1 Tax=Salimicrobium flavidum TaxID=570947 RepID=A0A1N7JIW5_9BACI|nr:ABC transporter permease [Salimicrobium flavidum]SIS49269.1 ABC-2 type transport system permease protein [Salimicrobium flavidum]